MGLVTAEIQLFNAGDVTLHERGQITKPDIRQMNVVCLVDSGAYMLVVSEEVRAQLGLSIRRHEYVVLADGRNVEVPVTEPIEVRFANRVATVDAVVSGNEVLLGAIPMEAMDVVIHPKSQTLSVNPAHPNIPAFRI